MDLNRVLLMGRLTRDVELRYLGNGTAVTDLRIAVSWRYRRQDGERVEETCFVDVTVWGRDAENCNQYLSKGRGVFIEGRLKFESWETQDGQKRNKLKVVADRVQFLPRGGGAPGGEPHGAQRSAQASDRGSDSRAGVSDYGGDHNEPRPSTSGGGFGGGENYHDDTVPF